ncbi:MAG: hypothetical protein EZS28_047294, partial [Streblomastix strix]
YYAKYLRRFIWNRIAELFQSIILSIFSSDEKSSKSGVIALDEMINIQDAVQFVGVYKKALQL